MLLGIEDKLSGEQVNKYLFKLRNKNTTLSCLIFGVISSESKTRAYIKSLFDITPVSLLLTLKKLITNSSYHINFGYKTAFWVAENHDIQKFNLILNIMNK